MKIELNDPAMPKGMEFYVNGLGMLENGKSVEFSDEQVEAFEALQGRSIKEAFKDSINIKLSENKASKEVSD